jgi:hypothetical protein
MKILQEVPLTDPVGGLRYIKFELPCATCAGSGWLLVPVRQAARVRRTPPRFICRQCQLGTKP